MGEAPHASVFCKINCVYLATCVTKYNPWQMRDEWRKHHAGGCDILISNKTRFSCHGCGAPTVFLAQLFLTGLLSLSGYWFKRATLPFTGVYGRWHMDSWGREHCNSQNSQLPLGEAQIYKLWTGNQGLLDSNQTSLIPLLPVAFTTHPCPRWQSSSLSIER